MNTQPEIICAPNIPDRLINDINGSSERVHLQTMVFDTKSEMSIVLDAVKNAALRGVKVSLAFDEISYLNGFAKAWRIRRLLGELGDIGVKVFTLGGSMMPNPAANRSHIKMSVIDNNTYFWGGVNLCKVGFQAYDFMIRNEDSRELSDILFRIRDDSRLSDGVDKAIHVSHEYTVLADSGAKGESIILDQSVELAKTAKSAWFVSQLSPGRSLEKALLEIPSKSRQILYNSPASSMGREVPVAYVDNRLSKLTNHYKGNRRLHAKFLVAEKPDGSFEAITGSHNLSDWGVRFGTKELALRTTNQFICMKLVEYAKELASIKSNPA